MLMALYIANIVVSVAMTKKTHACNVEAGNWNVDSCSGSLGDAIKNGIVMSIVTALCVVLFFVELGCYKFVDRFMETKARLGIEITIVCLFFAVWITNAFNIAFDAVYFALKCQCPSVKNLLIVWLVISGGIVILSAVLCALGKYRTKHGFRIWGMFTDGNIRYSKLNA